jgi:hypothetical protein
MLRELEAAEQTLRMQQCHLAARTQDLAIAKKAGRDTTEIQNQIRVTEKNIHRAELQILRLKGNLQK